MESKTPRERIEAWIKQEVDKTYAPEFEDRKVLMRHDLRQGALFGARLGFEAAREIDVDNPGDKYYHKYNSPEDFLKELEEK